MANIKFLDNVLHMGIIFKAGMIVDDAEKGLSSIAQKLVERGLAQDTAEPATHTAALVNGAQEALPKANTAGGQAPNVDADAARKAAAQAAQVAATPQVQNQVNDQAQAESQPRLVHQPTPEDIARTAAQVA